MEICSEEFFSHLHYISEVELPALKFIENAYNRRKEFHPSGNLIWLDKAVPWKDFIKDKKEILFVLF